MNKPTRDNLQDPYVLQLIEAVAQRDDEIERLIAMLEARRYKCDALNERIAKLEAEHEAGRFISRNSPDDTWERWVAACNVVQAALEAK